MLLDYSKESQEEQRLIVELSSLDQCLYFKSFGNKNSIQNQDSLQKYGSFARYHHQIKQTDLFSHNQPNNIQYFSEIDNKDEEYDTLFNQGSPFLVTLKANKQLQPHQKAESQSHLQQNKQKPHYNMHEFDPNPHHNQDKTTKYQQILKQQEFVFNKQKRQSINNLSKKNLPPNHKKLSTKNNTQSSKITTKNVKNTSNQHQNRKNIQIQQSQHMKYQLQCLTKNHNVQKIHNTKGDLLKSKASCKTQTSVNPKYETIQSYLEMLALDNRQKSTNKIKTKLQDKNNFLYSDSNSLECTFQPKILKKSQEMIKNDKCFVQRLSNNCQKKNVKIPYQPANHNKNLKLQRLEKLSQPRPIKTPHPDQIQQIPSFRPSLSKKSIEHMSNCTYDVTTRNKLWLQQKQEKIAKLKKEEQQYRQKKEQSSHQPSIKVYKGQTDVYFSQFGKVGLIQYFQRLSLKNKNLSSSTLGKDNTIKKYGNSSFNNKENGSQNINKQNIKKQTYEQAVKVLHNKIMKLKI